MKKSYVKYEHAGQTGNWKIYYSNLPVAMGKFTDNKLMYVAKAIYKEKTKSEKIFLGKGKTQIAARNDALTNAGINEVVDIEKYAAFFVDFNIMFGTEYYDPKNGGYVKFSKNNNGDPILVMASNAYFENFKEDLKDLGFKKLHSRKNDSESLFGMHLSKAEVVESNLIPGMRYTLEEVEEDEDGNRTFELHKDSVVMGPNDRLTMGVPGVTMIAYSK